MTRLLKVLVAVILVAACAAPAWPQVVLPTPAPGVIPMWQPVREVPSVSYAPNVPGNIFLVGRKFYYFYAGEWYRSKTPNGPWHPVRKKLPRPLRALPPYVFK